MASPSWLLSALQQRGAGQQHVPKWLHGKGSEKGKAAIRNPIMAERAIPPWLAAAAGRPANLGKLGAKGGPPEMVGRLRISQRLHGTIVECNTMMAWIKPDAPIDHPDAAKTKKGLYMAVADVVPKGLELSKDMQVTFFVYSDGTRLGAESCMAFKGSSFGSSEPKKEKVAPSKGKEKGAGTWTWIPEGKEKGTGKGNFKAKAATKSAPAPSFKSVLTKFDNRIPLSLAKGASRCPKGHPLKEIPPPFKTDRICDKCGAEFRKGSTCKYGCDYDECVGCSKVGSRTSSSR